MKYSSLLTMGLLVAFAPLAATAEEAASKPESAKQVETSAAKAKAPVPSAKTIEITAEEKDKDFSGAEAGSGNGDVADPIEGLNRGIYKFNEGVDTVILAPVARGYKYVVPEYGRDRVGNALNNLQEPVTFLNNALQGNVEGTFSSFWRFVINSTFGIGGMFDVARDTGLQPVQEDFGQTLASWGVGNGAYIVLPILGPSSARDTVGLVVDTVTNPFSYLTTPAVVAIKGTDLVDSRARLLDITDEIQRTSFDPYSTVKSAYIQHRNTEIDKQAEVE